MNQTKTILALDVGERRIGLALASHIAKLPSAKGVIKRDDESIANIQKLINSENIAAVVVGLPRGLDGQETKQTKTIRQFAKKLQTSLDMPVFLQDEALTSKQAEVELSGRKTSYNKEMVDALAATYILSDFLSEHPDLENL